MLVIGVFLATLVIQGAGLKADCQRLETEQEQLVQKKKNLQKEQEKIKEKEDYSVDHIRLHLDIAVSHLRENILHIMGQSLHPLIAHGSRHTLQGMGGAEDLIDRIHVLRILLQGEDLRIQILQMFIGFIKENLKILAYIHIILPPRLS